MIETTKYDWNGHAPNSATWSIWEYFGRHGFVFEDENKTIKQISNKPLSQFCIDYLQNTYENFNILDYRIIKENFLILENFKIVFNFAENSIKINNKNIKIESHDDASKPILKIYKNKIKVYNGMHGLVCLFTDGFWSKETLVKLLEKIGG